MSEAEPHTPSSCPGKSAKRVFAQMSRASTSRGAAGKDVDGRVKPGHDGARGRGFRVLSGLALTLILAIIGFVAWVYSLGPLPLDEARQVSTTVVDRNGKLLRAYAMADGRWRLPVDAKANVDPTYLKLLLAYEDQRFYAHNGLDPLALGRAALQLTTRGHIVSGGSTISHAAGAADGAAAAALALCKAAADRAGDRDRAQHEQGRDPRPLSRARALRRQSRRHPLRLDRLSRQGAEAAVAGRGRAAGGAAAIAGDAPARSLSRGGTQGARPRARPHGRGACGQPRGREAGQGRARAKTAQADADPRAACLRHGAVDGQGYAGHQADARCQSAEGAGAAGARPRHCARAQHLGRHHRGRQ